MKVRPIKVQEGQAFQQQVGTPKNVLNMSYSRAKRG